MTHSPDYYTDIATVTQEFFCGNCENDVEFEFEVVFDTRNPLDTGVAMTDVDCDICDHTYFAKGEKVGPWMI